MRIDVKKYLFVGPHAVRDQFFSKAQEAGIIHFIDRQPKRAKEVPQAVSDLMSAIKVLRGLPTSEQEEIDDSVLASRVTAEVLTLQQQLNQLEEEMRTLTLEIARVRIFGDFSLEDIAAIKRETGRTLRFYFASKKALEKIELSDEFIEVGQENNLHYFVAIQKEPIRYPKMVEMKIDKPVGQLRARLVEANREWHEKEEEIKTYVKYNTCLHRELIIQLNQHELLDTRDFVDYAINDKIFVIDGWVPNNKQEALQQLLLKLKVHCEEVAVEPTDVMPTYLENHNVARVGEDLVHIYDTPSKTDRDPSIWVLIFFSLFFAMIVNDAGYGLIFLALTFYIRYKVKKVTKVGKRFLLLVSILSFSCIAWGVATHSFFGLQLSQDNPLTKISVINWLVEKKAAFHFQAQDATFKEWVEKVPELGQATSYTHMLASADLVNKFSDNILMEIALLIGLIHIALSFLRYIGRNWAGIGWIAFLLGCYLYFPTYLDATSLQNYVFGLDPEIAAIEGYFLIFSGFGLAIVLSFVQNRFYGALEIAQIIQVFGDVLSYLRLYALGLAGAMVSSTVNSMAASSIGIFAVAIILIGHTVNIILAIMSGVIHGLRLNFLEWYHYSFEGGGKLFHPLKKIKLE